MAYKLQLKRGLTSALPTGSAGEPLFTTDTNDLYIGTGASNQRYQKYIASGTSSQFLKGDGSLDSNTYYLASNPSAYIALTALTASSPLSYNNTTGAFTIAQASGSANGYLSSTDWTTFNNKQNALTNPVTGTGTTNYLPKWTSGSAIGDSLAQDTGSSINVGTATTYPATKLVVGGSSANGGIVSEDTASTGSFVRILGDTSNGNLINYKNGTSLRFASSAADFTTFTEHARFSSSGNLLVNSTTDNGNRLQVTGNGYFSGNVSISNTTSSYRLSAYKTASGIQDLLELQNENKTIGVFDGVRLSLREFNIESSSTWGISDNTLTIGHQTNKQITLTQTGNLGLGVVPSAWASNRRAFQIGSYSSIVDVAGYTIFGNNTYHNGTNNYYLNNGGASEYYMQGGQHIWNIAASGTAGNAITFTQAMTLTAGGDLGLGNTSPSYRVDIEGSSGSISTVRIKNGNTGGSDGSQILLGNSANFTNAYFRLNGGGNSSQGGAGSLNIGLTESAAMTFLTANSERIRITSGGNVGIGTTSPVNLLQVSRNATSDTAIVVSNLGTASSTTTMSFVLQENDVPNGWFRRYRDGSAITEIGFSNDFVFAGNIQSSKTERLRITSGGNVGIGTTTPFGTATNRTVLSVNGTTDVSINVGTGGTQRAYLYAASTYADLGTIGALPIVFSPNNTERLRITSGGVVGIGTSSPSERLTVNGKILVQNGGDLYIDPNGSSTILASTGARPMYFEVNGANRMVIKSDGKINFGYLPTSSAGLSSGDIWNDGGTLKIV